MLNYPIGVQDFEKIRKGGFVYVDKTDLVYKLTRGSVYFLGRPRRFGKSLTPSAQRLPCKGKRILALLPLQDEDCNLCGYIGLND